MNTNNTLPDKLTLNSNSTVQQRLLLKVDDYKRRIQDAVGTEKESRIENDTRIKLELLEALTAEKEITRAAAMERFLPGISEDVGTLNYDENFRLEKFQTAWAVIDQYNSNPDVDHRWNCGGTGLPKQKRAAWNVPGQLYDFIQQRMSARGR